MFQQVFGNNNFVTWPAMTTINLEKFVDNKTSTYLGHLDQIREKLQSAKLNKNIHEEDFSLKGRYMVQKPTT